MLGKYSQHAFLSFHSHKIRYLLLEYIWSAHSEEWSTSKLSCLFTCCGYSCTSFWVFPLLALLILRHFRQTFTRLAWFDGECCLRTFCNFTACSCLDIALDFALGNLTNILFKTFHKSSGGVLSDVFRCKETLHIPVFNSISFPPLDDKACLQYEVRPDW